MTKDEVTDRCHFKPRGDWLCDPSADRRRPPEPGGNGANPSISYEIAIRESLARVDQELKRFLESRRFRGCRAFPARPSASGCFGPAAGRDRAGLSPCERPSPDALSGAAVGSESHDFIDAGLFACPFLAVCGRPLGSRLPARRRSRPARGGPQLAGPVRPAGRRHRPVRLEPFGRAPCDRGADPELAAGAARGAGAGGRRSRRRARPGRARRDPARDRVGPEGPEPGRRRRSRSGFRAATTSPPSRSAGWCRKPGPSARWSTSTRR